jgi:pimeloyl-ACP methyl ester carboxylesterase
MADGANPAAGSAALIAEWSNADVRVEIVPDTHHLPHRERPDKLVRLVCDFPGAASGPAV